jgi:hypothetical protein
VQSVDPKKYPAGILFRRFRFPVSSVLVSPSGCPRPAEFAVPGFSSRCPALQIAVFLDIPGIVPTFARNQYPLR